MKKIFGMNVVVYYIIFVEFDLFRMFGNVFLVNGLSESELYMLNLWLIFMISGGLDNFIWIGLC